MESLLDLILMIFLLIMALAILHTRHLLAMAMLFGLYSFLMAGLFLLMDAPDVAFTEAAVGAGISTVLMIVTLAVTGIHRERPGRIHWPALFVVMLTGGLLLAGLSQLPAVGDPASPATLGVARHYVEHAAEETGVPNLVTAVLASYRGFDTLGEVVVVFTAGLGVLLLLGLDRRKPRIRKRARKEGGDSETRPAA
ncbi:DUF4040 domain-containing protein [Bowmanella dokdonensis]|uniref:DUF4040 domain-containing protein n=1 Tax=Bowmanella dokdonensis TaxID=751969 RepID=A0A939IM77_9ALTE|nr:DUF4040 domain-containing protein [Bowmanella dokdonensis]MBN7825013.1 DUF4040 domain-containing protein [Bowmanella dokdonensis]